ncbi:hypothetical protein FF36_06375 [Frankia torreyi]|uniref:Uncharacterized protein n=1 Tax=Frankia torreyi TaxID=1856 RepID=A0A0D8B5H3_9ACTN|nr:hypothetical protein FF36_06375 [Frankia torreyi]
MRGLIIQLNEDDLPEFDLPPSNGLIISGPGEAKGDRVRVCLEFLPTVDGSTLHARRVAVRPELARQSLVIRPRVAGNRSTAVAFLAGRQLLEHERTAILPGPVVTSACEVPPYADGWRGIPLTVLLTGVGGEHQVQPVWEFMSPDRYTAWLAAGCP